MTDSKTKRIAELNDLCRQAMGIAGKLYLTEGISSLSPEAQSALIEKVQTFNAFTEDNDPYQERDFGAFDHEGLKIFWKIDYYDHTLTWGSVRVGLVVCLCVERVNHAPTVAHGCRSLIATARKERY